MKKIVFLLPASALSLSLAGAYGLYRHIFYTPVGDQNDDYALPQSVKSAGARARALTLIDTLNSRPYERVTITSFDGLQLCGRYYHTRDGAPLVILFHGYRGTPSRDFCGGASICFDLGCNVLLVEERGHGMSEGHTISFGVNERYDCLAWSRWAAERFRVPILLVGISMGATAVLLASALDLPQNVRGIIADCPYTSPDTIIRLVGRRRHLPMSPLMPFIRLGARVFGGFSLSANVNAAEAVRLARVPILLIHGEEDGSVPCDMSREIAAARPELVELHTFPGAWHGTSYLVNTERYTRLVREFCERTLADADKQSEGQDGRT